MKTRNNVIFSTALLGMFVISMVMFGISALAASQLTQVTSAKLPSNILSISDDDLDESTMTNAVNAVVPCDRQAVEVITGIANGNVLGYDYLLSEDETTYELRGASHPFSVEDFETYVLTNENEYVLYYPSIDGADLQKVTSSENIPSVVKDIDEPELKDLVARYPVTTDTVIIVSIENGTYPYKLYTIKPDAETGVDGPWYLNKEQLIDRVLNQNMPLFYVRTKTAVQTTVASDISGYEHECSESDFRWEVSAEATESSDGVMVYRCQQCGAVRYEAPISAMSVWTSNICNKIRTAKAGSTVVIDALNYKSFQRSVLDAFRQNPNVNIQINWLD